MAKPTTTTAQLAWSSNTNYASGVDAGTPTKIEPPTIADGWHRGDRPAAQYANWLQNKVYEWLEYFDGIVDATRDNNGVAGKTLIIYASSFNPVFDSSGIAQWYGSGGVMTSRADTKEMTFDLDPIIRAGQIITKIEAKVSPGAARAGGSRVRLSFNSKSDWNWPGVGTLSSSLIGSNEDNGSLGVQTISLTSVFPITVNRANSYYIGIRSGNTGLASPDLVGAVRITLTDPGPRNV